MSTNFPHRDNKMFIPANSDFQRAFDIQGGTVINAANGGQYGFSPDNFRYVQEQPYVAQRPYCVVLSTPAGFNRLPAGNKLHGLLRSFMETRTRNWGGLTARTSVDYHDITMPGGATLSFPIGSTRQFGTISHMALDPDGESFSKLFDTWITYLLADPVIRHPKIITINGGTQDGLNLDVVSQTSIYFEPNRTWDDVTHACLSLAQMPKEGPQYEFGYDVDQASGRVREIQTEFTGLFEFDTHAVKEIAREVMKRMPLYNPSGRKAPAGFTQPTSTLQGDRDGGLTNMMEQAKNNIVKPLYMP